MILKTGYFFKRNMIRVMSETIRKYPTPEIKELYIILRCTRCQLELVSGH